LAVIALIIFLLTYVGIIFTRLPGLNIDRPSAAIFGAVSMIALGVLTFDEAIAAIDFNTIALLLGMMLIIAVLELDGFFLFISETTISLAKTTRQLLLLIIFVTGISSALLVNDAVVLLFTPVILVICKGARRQPLPYLIAEMMSANAGSALTITGNPQNILIGMQSGFAYGKFLLFMLPISLGSLFLIFFVIKAFFKEEFGGDLPLTHAFQFDEWNYASMRFSVPIFIVVLAAFFASKELSISYSVIALVGGSFVLLFGKIKPSSVIKEVDWVSLIFFSGLFIVVRGIEKYLWLDPLISFLPLNGSIESIVTIHGLSLVLSQIVSNVPFVIVMLPFLKPLHDQFLWLALASGSTLAGNLTIIGAMANLIVIEIAKKEHIKIDFGTFLKIGTVVTLGSLILSILVMLVYAEFRI